MKFSGGLGGPRLDQNLNAARDARGPPDEAGAFEGRARWTLELLAGAMVKLTDHDTLSRETVRRRLAENHLKPWQRDMWCIPKVDAEYVARMEDVLDLYAEAPDPKRTQARAQPSRGRRR